ncbi:MAG: hypothetical protein SVK08_02420 [Halobacteriota archaeon]|nr:hypothetical protein [Halobacteriota archaeon]
MKNWERVEVIRCKYCGRIHETEDSAQSCNFFDEFVHIFEEHGPDVTVDIGQREFYDILTLEKHHSNPDLDKIVIRQNRYQYAFDGALHKLPGRLGVITILRDECCGGNKATIYTRYNKILCVYRPKLLQEDHVKYIGKQAKLQAQWIDRWLVRIKKRQGQTGK